MTKQRHLDAAIDNEELRLIVCISTIRIPALTDVCSCFKTTMPQAKKYSDAHCMTTPLSRPAAPETTWKQKCDS